MGMGGRIGGQGGYEQPQYGGGYPAGPGKGRAPFGQPPAQQQPPYGGGFGGYQQPQFGGGYPSGPGKGRAPMAQPRHPQPGAEAVRLEGGFTIDPQIREREQLDRMKRKAGSDAFWTAFPDAPKAPRMQTHDMSMWTNPITGEQQTGSSTTQSYQNSLKEYLDANPAAQESYTKNITSLRPPRIKYDHKGRGERGIAPPAAPSPVAPPPVAPPPIDQTPVAPPQIMQPMPFSSYGSPGKGMRPQPYGGGFGGYRQPFYGGGFGGGFGGYQPSPYMPPSPYGGSFGGVFNQGYGVPRGIGSLLSSYPSYMPPRMHFNPYVR